MLLTLEHGVFMDQIQDWVDMIWSEARWPEWVEDNVCYHAEHHSLTNSGEIRNPSQVVRRQAGPFDEEDWKGKRSSKYTRTRRPVDAYRPVYHHTNWRDTRALCTTTQTDKMHVPCVPLRKLTRCTRPVYHYANWQDARALCTTTQTDKMHAPCVPSRKLTRCTRPVYHHAPFGLGHQYPYKAVFTPSNVSF
jgi:hypothetical protein